MRVILLYAGVVLFIIGLGIAPAITLIAALVLLIIETHRLEGRPPR